MAHPGFYNTNINRAYPMVNGLQAELPDYAVADFGTIMSAESGFVEGLHSVFLSAIRKLGTVIEFEFQTDAPGLLGKSLIFRRDADAAKYVTDYTDSEDSTGPVSAVGCRVSGEAETRYLYGGELYDADSLGSIESLGSLGSVTQYDLCEPGDASCHGDVPWSGYLVSGDMRRLSAYLPTCQQLVSEDFAEAPQILLLVDTTATNGDMIASLQALFPHLDAVFGEFFPDTVPKYALVEYKDFEDAGEFATAAKNVVIPFTSDPAAMASGLSSLTASGGGDAPDGQLAALKWVVRNWTDELGGTGGLKIVIWLGDTAGWENGAKGKAYPTLTDVENEITVWGGHLYAINSRAAAEGLDGAGNSLTPGGSSDGRKQATTLTAAAVTGAVYNGVGQADASSIAKIIMSATLNAGGVVPSASCDGFYGQAYVEPSQIQNMDGAYVRTINVANAERTRATSATECREFCWAFPLQEHYVVKECLIGDILFKEGYNAEIRVLASENTITIGGRAGAGEGSPCLEVAIFPDEIPPNNRTTLDGSLRCDEIVRSINGVGGRFFDIVGGTGITITPVPEKHRIVVDIHMIGLAICPDPPVELEVADPTYSSDPCECGPEE